MVFYLTKILDEGTSNPIVARIGFQLGELLELCRIDKENKDDLSGIFFDMMKSILSAHADASNLIEELLLIESELELKGLQIQPRSATIPSSIKLDSIKMFFKHANETLKLLAQALAIFFDKGWTEAKFDPILKYIKDEQVKQNEIWDIVELLENNLSWLNEMTKLRNIDEHKHHKREKKKSFVENYVLTSTQGKLTLIRPKLCEGQEVLPFLLDANNRLFLLAEELMVSAIALFLPEPVSICEIPEKERTKNFPKRFKHCLSISLSPVQNH